jgi:predicted RNA-binding protein Jag
MSKLYYKKDDPTKVVSIVDDSQESFYQLSNGQMIKKDVFFKYFVESENVPRVNESYKPKNTPTSDFVDPNSFFTKSSLNLSQNDILKLKNTDPEKGVLEGVDRTEFIINTANKTKDSVPIINEKARQPLTQPQFSANDSIVKEVDETRLPIPDHTNTDVSQYRVYENDDDAYADFVNKGSNPQPTPEPKPQQPKVEVDQVYEDEKLAYGLEEANKRREIRLKRSGRTETQQPTVEQKIQQVEMDPSEIMFKTFKRNHDIKIKVEFSNKIGNPEFIKMMMENMDGDIVGFYKKLILNDIRNNFQVIENEVERQIKEEIFGTPKNPIVEASGDVIENLKKLANQLIDKSNEISFIDDLDEETIEESIKPSGGEQELELIPGGLTPAGKQLYKYIDEKGKVRESLPRTASKKGWTPLVKHES